LATQKWRRDAPRRARAAARCCPCSCRGRSPAGCGGGAPACPPPLAPYRAFPAPGRALYWPRLAPLVRGPFARWRRVARGLSHDRNYGGRALTPPALPDPGRGFPARGQGSRLWTGLGGGGTAAAAAAAPRAPAQGMHRRRRRTGYRHAPHPERRGAPPILRRPPPVRASRLGHKVAVEAPLAPPLRDVKRQRARRHGGSAAPRWLGARTRARTRVWRSGPLVLQGAAHEQSLKLKPRRWKGSRLRRRHARRPCRRRDIRRLRLATHGREAAVRAGANCSELCAR
jgi:hypothetical protein